MLKLGKLTGGTRELWGKVQNLDSRVPQNIYNNEVSDLSQMTRALGGAD